VDFIKPQPMVGGLNLIQWACLVGLVVVAVGMFTDRSRPEVVVEQV